MDQTLEEMQAASRLRHKGRSREFPVICPKLLPFKVNPKLEIARMKLAEEFEVKMMGIILKADSLPTKRPGRHKKQAVILRSAARSGRTQLKEVDFSKLSIAAGKVDAQPWAQESSTAPFQRPPAVYTNIPTPYGIATDLLREQLKKSG